MVELAMSAHPPIDPRPVDAPVSLRPPETRPDDAPTTGDSIAALFARQLEVLQAASARLSRAEGTEAVGRAVVEETGRIIDYHNARVYVLEPSGDLVPIAFEGRVGAYEKVDLEVLRTRLGSASPAGSDSTGSRSSSATRTTIRAARRSRAPTTSTNRCSSSRCATTTPSSA
jgi:hypothetical protein